MGIPGKNLTPGKKKLHWCNLLFFRHVNPCSAFDINILQLLMVTSLAPDNIYLALTEYPDKLGAAGIKSVTAIGDCQCPSTFAAEVHDGHRVAREMDASPQDPDMPFRREEIRLEQS
jgi:hypothetical protein